MPKSIQKILKLILHFENWPLRLLELAHLAPKRLLKMKIRKGPIFFVRPYSSDISCLQSITMENEYFPYFSVMPGDTVVDIGANIGSFCVSVGFREPTAAIYAVEPMRSNFDLLNKNIAINNLKNVTTILAGVSDKNEVVKFYHGKGTWFASGTSYKIDAIKENEFEKVPCFTLEGLFNRYNIARCDFLKMDCEGAEYKILFSCSDVLWTKIKKVALEFHNFEEGKNQFTIVEFLRGKGYHVVLPKKYERKEIGLIFATRV